MAFEERCCSYCGKINWDSETGNYNEKHIVFKGTPAEKEVECDSSGTVYVDGEVQ